MNRIKTAVTACFCLLALSCSQYAAAEAQTEAEPIRPLQVSVSAYTDFKDVGETNWVRYTVPEISLEEEGFEELDAVLDAYTESMRKSGEKKLEEYAGFMKESLDYVEEYEDFFSDQTARVMRADSRIFSFVEEDSSYAGGAHPNSWYVTHTYDSRTGQELSLTDILQDPDSLPETLEAALLETRSVEDFLFPELAEAIREEMKQEGTVTDELTGEEMPAMPGPYFTLGYDGITFWFAPYELTSYAYGSVIQTLYFSDYPDLVKPEYCEAADSYIVSVPQDTEIRLPASGEKLSWTAIPQDEYATDYAFTLKAGDAEWEESLYAFSFDCWLMHQNGRDFFVLGTSMEDDYHQLRVFRLEQKDGGRQIEETDLIGRSFFSNCATDPGRFVLVGGADMLSTFSVKRAYTLDETGRFQPLEEWDTIIDWSNEYYEQMLLTKTALEADTVDPDTAAITGSVTIPEGEKLHFVRTDCESWVDMRMQDGTLVRLYVEPEWPQKVNGVPAEDVFDNMMYAG